MNRLRLCLEQQKVYLITSVLTCVSHIFSYPTCLNWPRAINTLRTLHVSQVFYVMDVSPLFLILFYIYFIHIKFSFHLFFFSFLLILLIVGKDLVLTVQTVQTNIVFFACENQVDNLPLSFLLLSYIEENDYYVLTARIISQKFTTVNKLSFNRFFRELQSKNI